MEDSIGIESALRRHFEGAFRVRGSVDESGKEKSQKSGHQSTMRIDSDPVSLCHLFTDAARTHTRTLTSIDPDPERSDPQRHAKGGM